MELVLIFFCLNLKGPSPPAPPVPTVLSVYFSEIICDMENALCEYRKCDKTPVFKSSPIHFNKNTLTVKSRAVDFSVSSTSKGYQTVYEE